MRVAGTIGLVFAGVLASAGAAKAGPLSTSEIASGFGAVVFGNFSSTSDVEGPLVVGGNMSGASHTFNNNPRSTPPAGFGAVNVYGNASGGTYNVNNGGNVYVGGTNTAHYNFNGGGSYLASVPNTISDFASVGTGPLGLSAVLQTMAATSTIDAHDNNNVQFNATPVGGIAVFDVTAAALQGYAGFKVNLDGASTVVINVDASGTGGLVNLNNHFNNESTGRQNVIWNFYDATSVSFGTQWGGLMLAPDAAVTNSTDIEGVLVAGSFNGRGELHDYAFLGTIPEPKPVPEPATLALFGLGLGTIGLLRRRR